MYIFKKALGAFLITSFLGILIAHSVFAVGPGTFPPVDDFAILGSTYTNTLPGTVIHGDVGYVTGPALAPTVNGTTHINDGVYIQAGADQGDLLIDLNAEVCDFTYGSATDLATLPQPLAPGVYCVNAAASIGAAGITLSGNATYIFRIDGAFTTVANSVVTLAGGASACDIFWTPTAATTLGANSSFSGTIIDDSGITIGANVDLSGRALAYGGTVSTDADTIEIPTCAPAAATLRVVKVVSNPNGGTAVPSDFTIHVTDGGTDVAGSPQAGASAPGTSYTLTAGTYEVSEDANVLYTTTFSGDCNASGSITLAPADDMTCTVTNTDIAAVVDGGSRRNGQRKRVTANTSATSTSIVSSMEVEDSSNAVVLPGVTPGFPNTGYSR